MITELILPVLFIIYLVNGLIRLVRSYRTTKNKSRFYRSQKLKLALRIVLILLIPLLLIEFMPVSLEQSLGDWPNLLGLLFSAAISCIWIVYIRRLDIYEQEKWRYVILVFIMSCLTIWAVFPISRAIDAAGFILNGNPVNDFLYCFISIGMVEELVKLLPVLVIIKSRKIMNESYDYLFYASVSALGFAFVENTLYINESELYSVIARMLMSSVAHMTFSTTIFYGVLLSKYKFKKIPDALVYLAFFLLAALSHGFYDFWLINDWASQFSGITTLFFLASVHIWFTMLNNGINVSEFFNRAIPLKVDKLKAFLIYSLLIVFMAAFLIMGLMHGKEAANLFFWSNVFSFGYFFIYIIYSHNKFHIIRGYISPIHATTNFFVPPFKPAEGKTN